MRRPTTGLFRQAVAASPADHPDRAWKLSNLGHALRRRFERTGDLADLNTAVSAARQAVAASPADNPDRATFLSNLGARPAEPGSSGPGSGPTWTRRSRPASRRWRPAPADHPDRAWQLSNLGLTLQRPVRAGRGAGRPGRGDHRRPAGGGGQPRRPPRPRLVAVQPRPRLANPVRADRASGRPGRRRSTASGRR